MNIKNLLKNYTSAIFSLRDLTLLGEKINVAQLSNFVKKGEITRLKSGLFTIQKDHISKEHIAFRLYEPSYISLESALYEYGILPDVVFNITSITTKNTQNFDTVFGTYIYKNIKKELFFGYIKKDKGGQVYLIAEPEKALLDYLYLYKININSKEDVESLRFDEGILINLDYKKILEYEKIFNNKKLSFILTCLPLNK